MRLREFSLDLIEPLGTARGAIDRRRGLLVGVERDGVRGVGEAAPLPDWTEPLADCREALGDVDDPAAALEALSGTPAARHAVELALADAGARRAGEPLGAYLAADEPAGTVPVNATAGDADPETTVERAGRAVEAGFDCLKLKVGAGDLDRDLARCRAVRAAVGPAVTLRADANGAWDREAALRAVQELAGLGFAYVEQPLAPGSLAGHADLRGRGVGIALDESLRAHGLEAVLDADAADVLVLKPMALGGPERARRAAAAVRRAGATPVITTTVDAAVARTAAVHVAATIPDVPACGLATADLLAGDLGPDPVPVDEGAISVPEAPGTCGDRFDDLLW